jgi:hypothetical protein
VPVLRRVSRPRGGDTGENALFRSLVGFCVCNGTCFTTFTGIFFEVKEEEAAVRRCFVFAILLSLFCPRIAFAKHSDLAGEWYTADKNALSKELTRYLDEAKVPEIEGNIIGLICPHAGFRYSGPVAAYSYNVVKQKNPSLVILIGFSHRKFYPGKIAVLNDEYFFTPLGKVQVDRTLTKKIMENNHNVDEFPDIFSSENAIEMQIPFIQLTVPDVQLVVLALCDQRKNNCERLADILYKELKGRDDYVLISSSDMCHFLTYENANIKDSKTIEIIRQLDPEAFYASCMKEKRPDKLMCGYGATYTLMMVSEKLGADKVDILKYANSGDVSGNKDRVVGYLSALFLDSNTEKPGKKTGKKNVKNKVKNEGKNMFDDNQREQLLNIARVSIKEYLETGDKFEPEVSDSLLKENMGAFVTLHLNGKLRGCIGHMLATEPLYKTVRDMAIAASARDPRFTPLNITELSDIDLEISVLTPMRKVENYDAINIPGHGVMVKQGFRSGVYLPQVADETGWTRDEFMNSLCAHKAGIAADAWKKGDCDIYVFTAEVFGEKDIKEEK